MSRCLRLLVLLALTPFAHGQIRNGSFEAGSFTGWVVNDVPGPYSPFEVLLAGSQPSGLFFGCSPREIEPTDGLFAAHHGFDGAGPATMRLAQDVVLGACDTRLAFDWRAGWEMASCSCGATEARAFYLDVEPLGGGDPLARHVLLIAAPDTDACAVGQTSFVDLSAFAGQAVRLSFEWNIPQFATGPGYFELDDVRFTTRVANGSFEAGEFGAWTAVDGGGTTPLAIVPAGSSMGGIVTEPAHGNASVLTGFASPVPATKRLFQDVTLGPCETELSFVWRARYGNAFPITYGFRLDVEPAGGGTPLLRRELLSIPSGAVVADTGHVVEAIDLAAFAGEDVRISFEWTDPVGTPGASLLMLELDDVRFGCTTGGVLPRFGSGVNPPGFTSLSPPIVGETWRTRVERPLGAVGTLVVIGLGGVLEGFPLGNPFVGELLLLPPFRTPTVEFGEEHELSIRPNCDLIGRGFVAQGATFTLNPFRITLNNALDLVVGTQ